MFGNIYAENKGAYHYLVQQPLCCVCAIFHVVFVNFQIKNYLYNCYMFTKF